MSQISVIPISPADQVSGEKDSTLPVAPADIRESIRQVATAVRYLNSVSFAGEGREITFSVDRATRLPIIKVIDAQSKEIIQQWPRDYVLQVAEAQLRDRGTNRSTTG